MDSPLFPRKEHAALAIWHHVVTAAALTACLGAAVALGQGVRQIQISAEQLRQVDTDGTRFSQQLSVRVTEMRSQLDRIEAIAARSAISDAQFMGTIDSLRIRIDVGASLEEKIEKQVSTLQGVVADLHDELFRHMAADKRTAGK